MLVFYISFLFVISKADDTFTVHVFDKKKNVNITQYPELFAIQNIFDSITRQVTLKDGRQVQCKIPLQYQGKPFSKTNLTTISNLTQEQSDRLLYPLEDQCVQHRTFDFLYEYCFKKYARQFDDQLTMINGQKLLKETFSIGHSSQYNRKYNETKGIKSLSIATYELDSIIHKYMNDAEQFIIIDGCVAKLRKYRFDLLLHNYSYVISITTNTQTYIFNVKTVVHLELFILEQCAEQLIISDNFEISTTTLPVQKTLKDQIYLYHNVVYGLNLKAQDYFQPQQQLGIVFNALIHMIIVEKTYDACAIKVDGLQSKRMSQTPHFVKKIIVFDGNGKYEKLNGSIVIIENIVFFREIDTLNVNDFIVIYNNTEIMPLPEQYQIVEIDNTVARLSLQFTRNLRFEGKAFIKRHHQFNEKLNISSLSNNFSQEDQQLFDYSQLIAFKDFFNNQIINVKRKQFSGFAFILHKLKFAVNPTLQIIISSDQYFPVRISYLSNPVEKIYAKNLNSDGSFVQMEQRFSNNTIFGYQYWVLIDTEQDILYLGRGIQISLSNLMFNLKLSRRQSTIQSDFTINILKQSNYIKMYDLIELPLTNYTTIIQDTQIFHTLNYTGKAAIYEEQYESGSFCKPLNSSRRSEITLQCHPSSLLKFLSVTEPSTCVYKITIGTYLLCDYEQLNSRMNETQEQHIMCILNE